MDKDIIYQEKFAAKGFIAILGPITLFMFFLLLYHLFFESAEPFLIWTLFYLILLVAFFVLTLGFASFSINLTSEHLSAGFGIKKHRVPLSNIYQINPDDVSSLKYGGFGIRVAKVAGSLRLVYNTIGTPRCVVSLIEGKIREFVFSTKNPEEVINVVRAQLRLTR